MLHNDASEHRDAWLRCPAMVGRTLVHGRRVGIASSMCRATTWARWGADLGQILADLDQEPKTKLEAHMKLYVFH
jgi:hypothetical protein